MKCWRIFKFKRPSLLHPVMESCNGRGELLVDFLFFKYFFFVLPCKEPQLSAWRLSKWFCPTAAGKSADIGCEGKTPNAAVVKFYMRLRISLAGVKRASVSCNFLPCRFHLAGQIEKWNRQGIPYHEHVTSGNYVVIIERPRIIRLFIVTDVVRPGAKHDCLPSIFSLVCVK